MSGPAELCKRKGFSLVEMVVVTVLLGVFAVLTVSAVLPDLARARRAAAARRIEQDLKYVRQTAINRSLHTWVVFNSATESYTLYIENRANPGRANRVAFSLPDSPGTSTVTLTDFFPGVDIASASFNSGAEISFDNYGSPSDSAGADLSADGTVVVANGATVTVSKGTGAIRRSDG